MPSKYEVQERRRKAIRNILKANELPVAEQKDLVKLLQKRGIPATQSSVSRDLKELGAMRISGRYEIPDWIDDESPIKKAKGLVMKMATAGVHQVLLVTQPGAGGFVAEALEASQWEDVIGTVAGYGSVLVLTENKFFQDLVWHRLNYYLEPEPPKEEPGSAKTGG
jgi:transcriptional regulator of arginine metabolism